VPAVVVLCIGGYSLGRAADERDDAKMPSGLDPKTVECLSTGQQALEKGDLKTAEKTLSECVAGNPKLAPARYWLGMVYFLQHDADKSIAEFKEVLRLDPDNPLAMGMLGKLYSFDKSKLALAKDLLEKTVAIAPDNEDGRFDLGRVYAQQGDMEKAFKEFGTLFQSEIRFALYHTEFAKILNASGNNAEAKNHLERALSIAPDFPPAKELLAELNKGTGSPKGN